VLLARVPFALEPLGQPDGVVSRRNIVEISQLQRPLCAHCVRVRACVRWYACVTTGSIRVSLYKLAMRGESMYA
jgi:hypothetical protein